MFRLLAGLMLVAAAPPCLGQVHDDYRDEHADRLGVHLFSELATEPYNCPEYMTKESQYLVMYCGKTALVAEPDEGMAFVDAVMSPYVEAVGPWVTKRGRRHSRSYGLKEFTVTVRLDSRWGVASYSYPLQNLHCDDVADPPHVGGEGGVTEPVLLEKYDPEYPDEMRRKRVGGQVVVEAVVRRDGSVGRICLVRSTRPEYGIIGSAFDALRRWKYEPATLDGEPVEVFLAVVMDFSLH